MTVNWNELQKQFAQWPASRRWLVLLAAIVVTCLPIIRFAVAPLINTDASLQRERLQALQQQRNLQESIAMTEQALAVDIDRPLLEKIDGLREQRSAIEEQLQQQQQLMSVSQRQAFLTGLLNTPDAIELLDLDTQKPKVLHQQQSVALYEHKVQVRYRGGYFDVFEFLQTLLESYPQAQWQTFEYEVLTYPQAEVTLSWSLLSTDKEFISA
ncbi:MAG TPA: hypothetical protein DCF92_13300 [Idiomarina sp.]|nr:hypothetical protein [Idiomarina sp.]